MRRTLIATLFVILSATAAFAQQVGDRVVVTTETAKLKARNETVGRVRRGSTLLVKDAKGEWLWVISSSEKESVRGWINRRDVAPFDQSADEIARDKSGDVDNRDSASVKPIRLDLRHSVSFYKRGLARYRRGDFDKAIADFDQAIRFDPHHANAWFARGVAWQSKGDFVKSLIDFDEAIRLDPNQAAFHANRGVAWHRTGEYDKARADWTEAIRLDPKNVHAHRALAWLLATCSDSKLRDGRKAVELATNACELSGGKDALGAVALAAAYAETGDFESAVKWQEESLRLCPEDDKAKWTILLKLYKLRKPYREPGPESKDRRPEIWLGSESRYSIVGHA
jgi:tetratricopeptide (TPR) repeat protein